MTKLIKIAAVLMVVVVVLSACGSKNSIPNAKKIENDLIDSGRIHSVEKLEITDTVNQKSTIGVLMITVNIDYTNTKMEKKHSEGEQIFYDWTDNDGWKLVISGLGWTKY